MSIEWRIGARIQDRWQVYNILRGGMGIVYVVYDYTHHSVYAAKTFQDEIFARHPHVVTRFTQEALTWTHLDEHQNVTAAVMVQTIGGKPYLFLEYVSGGDLSSWINTPRLTGDLAQVLRFALQFCDGMKYARAKGIMAHRDIKPQNCLVTADRVLKVTDFGLAKVFDEVDLADIVIPNAKDLHPGLTLTGQGAGTPPYMAPEQFKDAKYVDVRADVYSFGVLLFQMVTGTLPFKGRTWAEYQQLHKTQPAPTLAHGPEELARIVRRCLAKEVDERYQDFGEVREELAAVYTKMTGEPPPEAATEEVLNAYRRSNRGASLQELGRTAEALECYAQAIEINSVDAGVWSNKGNALISLGRVAEALECLERALEINPRFEEAWVNKGNALTLLGRMEEALECHSRALEINPRIPEAWTDKGSALASVGRLEEALDCFTRALKINPHFAEAWSNKGNVLSEMGRVPEALDCLGRAIEINPRLTKALFNTGVMLGELGHGKEALYFFDRIIELDSRDALAWGNKSVVLIGLGRHEEALDGFARAIEIDPQNAETWYNKGVALEDLGRLDEALSCFGRASDINPLYESAWYNKGVVSGNLGHLKEALDCFERTIELNPHNAAAWYNKGAALNTQGLVEEARVCYARALELNPHLLD